MGEYEVVGRREYRGHKPGVIFEARIDRNAEGRAIRRGDIRLLRVIKPRIPAGSWVMPDGWLPPPEPEAKPVSTEGPARGLASSRKE